MALLKARWLALRYNARATLFSPDPMISPPVFCIFRGFKAVVPTVLDCLRLRLDSAKRFFTAGNLALDLLAVSSAFSAAAVLPSTLFS